MVGQEVAVAEQLAMQAQPLREVMEDDLMF
jgi:hypothetical protein